MAFLCIRIGMGTKCSTHPSFWITLRYCSPGQSPMKQAGVIAKQAGGDGPTAGEMKGRARAGSQGVMGHEVSRNLMIRTPNRPPGHKGAHPSLWREGRLNRVRSGLLGTMQRMTACHFRQGFITVCHYRRGFRLLNSVNMSLWPIKTSGDTVSAVKFETDAVVWAPPVWSIKNAG